ncbi:MAG: AAA family ATPase [Terriglobales bacterium]
MTNPFEYGGVVGEGAFCNRKQEISDLIRAMQNSEKLFLYSERRFGKTSLVKLALRKLPKKEFLSAYVDLWPTDGEASFAAALAKALAESLSSTTEKLLDTAKKFFGRLVPGLTADEEGRPVLRFDLQASAAGPELEEVLSVPARIAEEGSRRVVIVLDEFQQILEYETDLVERRLRSAIQNHRNVSYIFLGSRKHLIQKMFLDKSRPLYRAAGHYPLKAIEADDWVPFIRKRFADAGKSISHDRILSLCELTEGHPFYTQHLCHVLWDQCPESSAVTQEAMDAALGVLLDRESYAYTTLWGSLAINQKRVLRGLAQEPGKVQPFSAEFTQRYGLGSASNAQRAIEALLEKDAIDRDNGSFVIVDRFFRIWIQRQD